jgi:hypothetical protein
LICHVEWSDHPLALPGELLPLVVEPENVVLELAEWAGANQNFIETNLLKHGAILFRGFDVNSVVEFERFAALLSYVVW